MINKKQIHIFCKGNISSLPPVMQSIKSCLDLDYRVTLYTMEISPETEKILLTNYKEIQIFKSGITKTKIHDYLLYRNLVNKNYKLYSNDITWIATFDTAINLYKSKVYRTKFILSVLELYDTASLHLKFFLHLILHNCENIVVSEYNRACILRTKYRLKSTPYVLPNKFDGFVLSTETKEVQDTINKIHEFSKGRKVILYQGLITKYRNLETLSEVLKDRSEEFVFVLIGPDFNYLDILIAKNDNVNIMYAGNFPAPLHLGITAISDIGIVIYDFYDLNNIYCAPNKIWEYSKFGVPMLGSSVPGLKYTIELGGCGVCVNFHDNDSINLGLDSILENMRHLSDNGLIFYNSLNMKDLVGQLIYNVTKSS